ncbi:hypothetical protein IF2G_01637 [Cordyceps javanica]|nr:hypothetical protein IF2G_01637 [Cordyceps javanica]
MEYRYSFSWMLNQPHNGRIMSRVSSVAVLGVATLCLRPHSPDTELFLSRPLEMLDWVTNV